MTQVNIPPTIDEARRQGLKPLSEQEYKQFLSRHKMAVPPVPVINCSQHPVGTKCLEVPGSNGETVVVYCDENHNCVDRFLVSPGG